jgi:xyloglucan fucosyltransferase
VVDGGVRQPQLAGVKPWLLPPPRNVSPCVRMTSMEPCFHVPPNYDCRAKSGGLGAVLQHVRHCEDVDDGLKLFY